MSPRRLGSYALVRAALLALVFGMWVVGNGGSRVAAETGTPTSPPSVIEPDTGHHAPRPRTPIEHLIVVMQENHTFDNYFGTYPGADGTPPGTCLPTNPNAAGGSSCVAPFHFSSDGAHTELADNELQAIDLAHNEDTFQEQYNNGRMDGFVYALDRRNQAGSVAMGHYDDSDLPFYWNLADEYVLFDHFFSSVSGGSFLNHLFWIAGASGGNKDGIP